MQRKKWLLKRKKKNRIFKNWIGTVEQVLLAALDIWLFGDVVFLYAGGSVHRTDLLERPTRPNVVSYEPGPVVQMGIYLSYTLIEEQAYFELDLFFLMIMMTFFPPSSLWLYSLLFSSLTREPSSWSVSSYQRRILTTGLTGDRGGGRWGGMLCCMSGPPPNASQGTDTHTFL